MSKTAFAIGEIAAAIVIMVLSFGAGSPIAVAMGAQAAAIAFSVGLSAGISGVFGLLQPLLNPNDTSVPGSQQNYQNAAAYRRVIYGYMETGGVLTYDNSPAGSGPYQNTGPTSNWRHQIYTVASHEIASFQRGGNYHVVIDGVETVLAYDSGSGYYFPADGLDPYGGQGTFPSNAHIGFEFDLGNPADTAAFSGLTDACPDWQIGLCIQKGRAKVHVAMRYDYHADGSQVGSANMTTSAPIFVNGRVPTFRFQVTGKNVLDPRSSGGGGTVWAAHAPYSFAQYVIDSGSRVQIQLNGPGGTFESGTTIPNFAASNPGDVTIDNECSWLNGGVIQTGTWPGPDVTIGYPYVFRDPNGNLQLLTMATGPPTMMWPLGTFITGNTEPTWATVPGAYTADGGESSDNLGVVSANVTNGGGGYTATSHDFYFVQGGAYNARGTMVMTPGGGGTAPYNYKLGSITVDIEGSGYTGTEFDCSGALWPAEGPPYLNAHAEAITGSVGGGGGPVLAWLCLGVPGNFAFASNLSNPALVVYDYLTNTDYGLSVDPTSIDVDSVIAAANICEEQVVVNIAGNGGSVSENLYDCNGVFDHGAARGDVLKALLSSMAGICIPPGDIWHVFAGAYNPPTAALTDADLRDSIKGDFRISRRDICNGVKGTFIPSWLPCNTTQAIPGAWRWTDFPPYQGNGLNHSPNYLAEDGGQVIWKDTRFGFTTSLWMVQRLAKITLQQLRFQVSLSLACKLTAFPIQAGDTITFTHARWAGLAVPPPTVFFVTQATLVLENRNGVPALGIDLLLRQHDPSVYEFTAPISLDDQGEYSTYGSLGTIGG